MSDERLKILEDKILKLEQANRLLYRSRQGLRVNTALNTLGQNTKINGDLDITGDYLINGDPLSDEFAAASHVGSGGAAHADVTTSADGFMTAADKTKLNGITSLATRFIPLTTPLTSTSWDGDSFSTTAKTKIDLSSVFSVPAGVKAVLVRARVRDSASASGDYWLGLSPNNTALDIAMDVKCPPVNDLIGANQGVVPCDDNGDIYYQISASGFSTLDVFMQIWGYWL